MIDLARKKIDSESFCIDIYFGFWPQNVSEFHFHIESGQLR